MFEEQVTQTWANIIALLNEGNMGVDDLVKINGFVVGAENFPAYAAARKKVLGDAKPASTAIIAPALAMPNWLVEIEVIAAGKTSLDSIPTQLLVSEQGHKQNQW